MPCFWPWSQVDGDFGDGAAHVDPFGEDDDDVLVDVNDKRLNQHAMKRRAARTGSNGGDAGGAGGGAGADSAGAGSAGASAGDGVSTVDPFGDEGDADPFDEREPSRDPFSEGEDLKGDPFDE
jgi:hypothetical protein